MRFASLLGDEAFYVVLFPASFWFWNRSHAVRLTIVLCLSIYLNFVLKDVFHLPRPEGAALIEEHGFAFPSGHAQHAAVLWGYVVWATGRHAGIATLAVLLVGLSRVYLGVHWPSDVIGGWAIGLSWLMGFIFLCGRLESRLTPFPPLPLIGLLLSITMWFGLFWEITYAGIVMGALFGLVSGGIVAERLNVPSSFRSPAVEIAVLVVGVLGLYGIYCAVAPFVESGEGALFLALAVIGIWISLCAPWLSVRGVQLLGLESGGEGSR